MEMAGWQNLKKESVRLVQYSSTNSWSCKRASTHFFTHASLRFFCLSEVSQNHYFVAENGEDGDQVLEEAQDDRRRSPKGNVGPRRGRNSKGREEEEEGNRI